MPNPLHDKVFDFLETYRNKHPQFVYWLRERNTKNRLSEGFWFQGNPNYAWVGLYDRAGGSNMTRSVGLVFVPNGDNISCHFEIVFNEEKDPEVLQFYSELIKLLGGFEKLKETQYRKLLSSTDGFKVAENFLDNIKPAIDTLVSNMGLHKLFINKAKFDKKINTVLSIKNQVQYKLIPVEKIAELKSRFASYKASSLYAKRVDQLAFIAFAKRIITECLKMDLTNEALTAILQITSNRSKPANVQKYLSFYFKDTGVAEGFFEEYKGLNVKGFTTSTRGTVSGLSSAELAEVKFLFETALETTSVADAVELVEDYDEKNIPQVKKGIYSPSLYYLNSKIFPIQNNSHIDFIEWCGHDASSYPLAILLFHEVSQILGEPELGIIDSFTHTFINHTPMSSATTKSSLNTILYGPPGTGKTYATIAKAVSIANPEFNIEKATRSLLKDEFNRLQQEGQIEFTSFHQSMSYEDFIEGIKPSKPDESNTLKYEIQDGIFKRICKKASYKPDSQTQSLSITTSQFENGNFYKISLGNTLDPEDDNIYQFCIDHNCIALGWGDDIDFTGKSPSEVNDMVKNAQLDKFGGRAVNTFIHYIADGDFVLVSNGNAYCRAIGRIIGDYFYTEDPTIRYHQFRPVEWLVKDVNIPVNEIYNKSFSQQSIYQLVKNEIKREFFIKSNRTSGQESMKNFILIIDEINRGNVSQIFGELITLIESDKRKGNDEELEVVLPYSKEKNFSVPSNLYIIGTMNTADRSVEALDTALRRRFVFEEVMPDNTLLHPRNILANFWNQEKYAHLDYDGWKMEPYKTINEKFIQLVGITEEIEDAIVDNDKEPEREHWIPGDFDGIDENVFSQGIRLDSLLEVINKRIKKLLSGDQQIGHAYFINVASLEDVYEVIYQKLIPQLQEYFYGDFGKIGLIIGKQFIHVVSSDDDFADFDYADKDLLSEKINYEINSFKSDDQVDWQQFEDAVKSIYKPKKTTLVG